MEPLLPCFRSKSAHCLCLRGRFGQSGCKHPFCLARRDCLREVVYLQCLDSAWAGNYFGSLLYALLFVTVCWLFGYILYKKNIYIKL